MTHPPNQMCHGLTVTNNHVAWKCLASFEQMPALHLNHGTLWFVPKDMYENTCGSLVHNSPKLEATLISINSECINKCQNTNTDETSQSNKNEQTTATYDNTAESHKYKLNEKQTITK